MTLWGAMRVKNEARWIREGLGRMLQCCARVVVFDDHSTDATRHIVKSFGPRAALVCSPFNGLDEARDKNYILKVLIQNKASWVLWLDGDEALQRSGPAKVRQLLRTHPSWGCFWFPIVYLWGNPRWRRVDGVYGRFRRPCLFRLTGQNPRGLYFKQKGGVNFHCGQVPQGLGGRTGVVNIEVKHYGYMLQTDRLKKYRFYTHHDPNNRAEDHYRHLAGHPQARYAGPNPKLVHYVDT